MKFGQSSIECSYIQHLLYNFYIPTIRILQPGDFPYENEVYIKDGGIYSFKEGKEIFNESYVPGKYYKGITRNLVSESNNYNIRLHELLGHYLRFIKSYYSMDLMPLYNCFSNRFIDTFSLPINVTRKKGSVIKEGYKLFAFPVRFGSSYSLFCKDNSVAEVQICFFNGKKPLELYYEDSSSKTWINFKPGYINISQFQENIYQVKSIKDISRDDLNLTNDDNNIEAIKTILRNNQTNLYLMVQIPQQNASNLLVIEDNSTNVINNSLIEECAQKPYSDKLFGYLIDYYITPLDEILENIEKILKLLNSKYYYIKDSDNNIIEGTKLMRLGYGDYKDYIKGTFDLTTRKFIYNLYRFRGISDFTGYIDKDVESLIVKESK